MIRIKKALLLLILIFLSRLSQAQEKTAPASPRLTGKAIYTQHCMTCHQVDGAGAQNMIPPLIKTDYVLGDKAQLIKILLNGMNGEIKVNGDMYSNEMPSQAFLTDKEIAAVLTYVRNSFGNKASVVTSGEVKKTRATIKK
ncbi:cytochrome c [Flavihumibacter sp. R14]|nr:cytochrome c [Flavihumibacter soli]